MKPKKNLTHHYLLVICLTTLPLATNAALYDRGNGLIYDSVLNITWLQDANYAKTSGYTSTIGFNNGFMTPQESTDWVSQLNYGGFDNWRLPTVGNNPQAGWGIIGGELGYMNTVNLGNPNAKDDGCNNNPSRCLENTGFIDGSTGEYVSFLNIKSNYWYSDYNPEASAAQGYEMYWTYNFDGGVQLSYHSGNRFAAWAVSDGDISTVPIPAAFWLFSAGLFGLISVATRKT